MFIQRKFFLNNLKRLRVSEGRDLDNGLRLDRNEKVDTWPNNLLEEIFRTKKELVSFGISRIHIFIFHVM